MSATIKRLGWPSLATAAALVLVSCSELLTPASNEPLFQETRPAWINASWTGGAKGVPNDRRDDAATEWTGNMCPPNGVRLWNQTQEFAGLTIQNTCPGTVWLNICVSKGIMNQPEFPECAQDPFQTPSSRLLVKPISSGGFDFINTQ